MKDVEQHANKKRVRIHEQDDASMKSHKTTDYVAGEYASVDSMDEDLSQSERAQGSQNLSEMK